MKRATIHSVLLPNLVDDVERSLRGPPEVGEPGRGDHRAGRGLTGLGTQRIAARL